MLTLDDIGESRIFIIIMYSTTQFYSVARGTLKRGSIYIKRKGRI